MSRLASTLFLSSFRFYFVCENSCERASKILVSLFKQFCISVSTNDPLITEVTQQSSYFKRGMVVIDTQMGFKFALVSLAYCTTILLRS